MTGVRSVSYEFTPPEFVDGAEPEEIQQRMMDALPDELTICPEDFRMILQCQQQ